ncbi:MAG: hypothetical protein AABZ61_11440, partial [Bacteroidota bacterium]
GAEGGIYPRSIRPVIYQDCIIWGGKTFLDPTFTTPAPQQTIRVGGQKYVIGTHAGRIIGTGAGAAPADTSSPDVRVYRIRRDYRDTFWEELRRDAADYFETSTSAVTEAQMNQIYSRYEKDWREWPVQYGAPYIERNGTPGFQAPHPELPASELIRGKYDEPGVAGADPNVPADQVIWTVYNDLDRSATLAFSGSEPLGLEVQVTLWAYKGYNALGNIYFKKVKLINKGGVDIGGGRKGSFWIDSMFVGQWSDPDIGDYADDLVGCDPQLNMGFAYNSKGTDEEFQKYNLPPPAIGYDYLQGPIVPGTPSDTGVFDLKRVRGKKNLAMTSFTYDPQVRGGGFTFDPRLRLWRQLQGFMPDPPPAPWRLYPHPPGVSPTRFPLSGDPVTQSGFVD